MEKIFKIEWDEKEGACLCIGDKGLQYYLNQLKPIKNGYCSCESPHFYYSINYGNNKEERYCIDCRRQIKLEIKKVPEKFSETCYWNYSSMEKVIMSRINEIIDYLKKE